MRNVQQLRAQVLPTSLPQLDYNIILIFIPFPSRGRSSMVYLYVNPCVLCAVSLYDWLLFSSSEKIRCNHCNERRRAGGDAAGCTHSSSSAADNSQSVPGRIPRPAPRTPALFMSCISRCDQNRCTSTVSHSRFSMTDIPY